LGEMGTFAAHRHRRSPSCCMVGHRGRAYPKATQMQICDKTRQTGATMSPAQHLGIALILC
jgi:hypothetical protein